jgi:hypothetical protein
MSASAPSSSCSLMTAAISVTCLRSLLLTGRGSL